MLNGRHSDRDSANKAAAAARESWMKVRVIKLWACDFMVYVHGGK